MKLFGSISTRLKLNLQLVPSNRCFLGCFQQRRFFSYEDTSEFYFKGTKPKVMVIHPIVTEKRLDENLYEAEEALNLARAAKLDIIPGPTEPRGGWNEDEFKRAETVKNHRGAARERFKSSDHHISKMESESDDEYDLDDEIWKTTRLREQFSESCLVPVRQIHPGNFFGEGKLTELSEVYSKNPSHFVFVNTSLSPAQLRNVELVFESALAVYHRELMLQKKHRRAHKRDLNAPLEMSEEELEAHMENLKSQEKELPKKVEVFDRYRMVLEVMSQRSRTALAKSQVTIAKLSYMHKRVHLYSPNRMQFILGLSKNSVNSIEQVRGWTEATALSWQHDESETFLEYQKRIIQQEMKSHKDRIASLKESRERQRKKQKKDAVAKVALVGYTNAGKTMVMNRLTNSELRSRELMFETMETAARGMRLPSGSKALLVDSIGFVADLPSQLYEAFSATLEETLDADVLLHIRDVSHPLTEQHKQTVIECLHDAGVSIERLEGSVIEVWNKVDKLTDEVKNDLLQHMPPGAVAISALENENMDGLLKQIESVLNSIRGRDTYQFKVNCNEFNERLQFLMSYGAVDNESYTVSSDGKYFYVKAVMEESGFRRYLSKFGDETCELGENDEMTDEEEEEDNEMEDIHTEADLEEAIRREENKINSDKN